LMNAQKFTVLIQPAEEGGFVVKCLEIPIATQGETKEEALKNIKEAIEGYLEVKAELDNKNNLEEVKVTIDKVIVKELPEVKVSKEEEKEINRSIQEMKNGDFVSLDELKGA